MGTRLYVHPRKEFSTVNVEHQSQAVDDICDLESPTGNRSMICFIFPYGVLRRGKKPSILEELHFELPVKYCFKIILLYLK